jgi:hypothetical protein
MDGLCFSSTGDAFMGHRDKPHDWEAEFARERAIRWATSFAARSSIAFAVTLGLCALAAAPITPVLVTFYAVAAVIGVVLWDTDKRAFARWDLGDSGVGKMLALMMLSLIVQLTIIGSALVAEA